MLFGLMMRVLVLIGVWLLAPKPAQVAMLSLGAVGFGAVVINRRLLFFDFNDLETMPAAHGQPRQPSFNATIGTPQFIAFNQKIDPTGKRGVTFQDVGGTRAGAADGRAFAWDDVRGPGPDAEFWLVLNTAGFANLHLRFDYRGASAESFNLSYSRDSGFSFTPLFYRIRMVADDAWHSIEIDLSGRHELQNAGQIIFRFHNFDNNGAFRVDNVECYGDLLEADFSAPAIADDRDLPPAVCGVIGDPECAGFRFPFTVASLGDDVLTVNTNLTGDVEAVRDVSVMKAPPTMAGDQRWELVIGGVGTAVGIAQIHIVVWDSRGNHTNRVVHFGALLAQAAPASLRTFYPIGAADASAAAFVGPDHFMVANDEDQLLRVYPVAAPASGLPHHTSGFLLPDAPTDDRLALPETREVDIEGVFKVGTRYYYTASLSNASDGSPRPNRDRIFCLDHDGAQFSFIGSYHYLLDDLTAWDQADGHGLGADFLGIAGASAAGKRSSDPDGLNVEGLAALNGNPSAAYMGFRAPLVGEGKALIVPILNFTSLAESKKGGKRGMAEFGTPILLDLGGRGIRSMVSNGTAYLMLAGPVGDEGGDFALFVWDGGSGLTRHAANLDGLRPEGILGWNADGGLDVTTTTAALSPHSTVVLVSDLGSLPTYYPEVAQKDLPLKGLKYFRVDYVTLGAVVGSVAGRTSS